MKKLLQKLAFCALSLAALATTSQASVREAEIDGYRIGRSLEGSMFKLRLVKSGVATAGLVLQVPVKVEVGNDYCICVGHDNSVDDIDIEVISERGNTLAKDKTRQSRAAVSFRSEYSGVVDAWVHIKSLHSSSTGCYAIFAGVLEIETVNTGNDTAVKP